MRKLTEAVQIAGSTFIATAKGYDLFDILNYTAAQNFVIKDTSSPAGRFFLNDEDTFNRNYRQNSKIYYFAKQNTNEVEYLIGVDNPISSAPPINIYDNGGENYINLPSNIYLFSDHTDSKIRELAKVPLYLVPDSGFECSIDAACIVSDNCLMAVIPQLLPEGQINLDFRQNAKFNKIDRRAFCFGAKINSITLDSKIDIDEPIIFNDTNVNHIYITEANKPASWPENPFIGNSVSVSYLPLLGVSNNEIEKEENEDDLTKIKQQIVFKEEKNSITIISAKPGVKVLDIPEKINNKPVTKIAPYAFYNNTDLQQVNLPLTIKFIGAGSFAFTCLQRFVYLAQDCVIAKNACYGTDLNIFRRHY